MARTPTLPPPPALAKLAAAQPVALFLDFDGTLIELAPEPDAIEVPAGLAARLHALRDRMDGRLALVSGRALGNLSEHLGDLTVARAGSHGASRFLADGQRIGSAPEALPEDVVEILRDFCASEGLIFEAKSHGGAIHYRQRPDRMEIALSFARNIAKPNGLEIKTGKDVVELVRPGASKGAAVRAFMDRMPFAETLPVFIGDDVTDEDGFVAAQQLGGFGIAVGDRPSAAARYRLNTVSDVYEWLAL